MQNSYKLALAALVLSLISVIISSASFVAERPRRMVAHQTVPRRTPSWTPAPPTFTPEPSLTPVPSNTHQPTLTSQPTNTGTPVPTTLVPVPTQTATRTKAPVRVYYRKPATAVVKPTRRVVPTPASGPWWEGAYVLRKGGDETTVRKVYRAFVPLTDRLPPD